MAEVTIESLRESLTGDQVLVFNIYRKVNNKLEYVGMLNGMNDYEAMGGGGGSGKFTEEPTKVGKWVDGSPIYRQVLSLHPDKTSLSKTEFNGEHVYLTNYNLPTARLIVSALMTGTLDDNSVYSVPVSIYLKNGTVHFAVDSELKIMDNTSNIIVEYVGTAE